MVCWGAKAYVLAYVGDAFGNLVDENGFFISIEGPEVFGLKVFELILREDLESWEGKFREPTKDEKDDLAWGKCPWDTLEEHPSLVAVGTDQDHV